MFDEAKTTIRQRDWLTLVGEKIRREQVRTVGLLVKPGTPEHRNSIIRNTEHRNTKNS